jgi:glycosyltransferase involved in cell wall biosynthesis
MNILFITDEITYVSGVSKHLFYLLRDFSKDKNYNIYLVCPGGDFVDEFKKLEINIILKTGISHKERSFINFFKCIWFLYNLIDKQNIQIIHSHTHYAANISWWTSKLKKVITIQTIHGIQPPGGMLPHFIADYFITVNKNTINYLISIGKRKDKIYFVNLGLPFPEKYVKNYKKIKIIFASRLVPEKGADIYIDSIALVKNRLNQKVSFLMAGEGECEKELKEQIAKLKIDVKFLGKVKDTYEYLKETHIFVFSSRYKTEGFPLAIIEAIFNGNLIITSDFISLNEIFEENKDCLVFHNNDPAQLAEKLILAINNYEDYSGMISNGLEKARINFSMDKMLSQMKNIYCNVK